MRRKTTLGAVGLAAATALATGPAAAVSFSLADTEFTLGGYIKLDVIHSIYSEGPAPANRGRQFTIPAFIPTGDTPSDSATDFTARETRFNFSTVTKKGDHGIRSFIELDFLGVDFDRLGASGTPNSATEERLVNSADVRLRHAFIAWTTPGGNEWLFGQTWSTFMDLGAYPDLLDFIGPSEGMTFVRQPQIRFTRGPFQFSLENPETTVQPNASNGGGGFEDNVTLPDAVGKYRLVFSDGSLVSFSAVLRRLDGDGIDGVSGDNAFGYGVNVSGKKMIGRDDIRFQFNYGDGIGRYLGLNTARGAVIDNGGDLEAIEAFGGYITYRHLWNTRWRSNLSYGYFQADNDVALTGGGVTERAQSINVNLIHSPFAGMDIGLEYIYDMRELENGDDGTLNRIQFSAKYSF